MNNQARKEAHLKSQAMRANFDQLVKGTSSDISNIALQCFAKSLIPQHMIRAATPEILNTILCRVSTDVSGLSFDTFCQILEEEASTEYLVDELRRKLKMLRRASRRKNKPLRCIRNRGRRWSPALLDQDEINSNSSLSSDQYSDIGKLSDNDDEDDDDDHEIRIGRISSVNHPEFLHPNRSKSPVPPSSSYSHNSRPTSPSITQKFDKFTIEDACCEHAREIEKLRKDKKILHKACKEKLHNLQARQHLKLKMMKWQRRQQMQKMKHKLYQFQDSLLDSRALEEELSTKLCYAEMECSELEGKCSQLKQKLQVRYDTARTVHNVVVLVMVSIRYTRQ